MKLFFFLRLDFCHCLDFGDVVFGREYMEECITE